MCPRTRFAHIHPLGIRAMFGKPKKNRIKGECQPQNLDRIKRKKKKKKEE